MRVFSKMRGETLTGRSPLAEKLLALAAFFFLALPVAAQTQTAVSATITDPNGIPYANGTFSIQLIPTANNPSVGGAAIQGAFNGSLSATRSFSASLWPNASITPASTQWSFTVCSNSGGIQPPLGTGTQCTPPTAITISGTAQVLSTTLSNVAPKLTNFVSTGAVTSVTGTAPVVSSGGVAPAISCPTCTTSVTGTPPIVSSGGTTPAISCPTCNVTAANVSPLNTFTFSTACAPSDIRCFQVADNAQAVFDAGMTASSGTITSSGGDPSFTVNDVGHFEEGFFNCSGLNEDLCHSNCAPGTITAFVSAHQVTVSPVCTNNSTAGKSNIFIWGTDDCTPLTNGYKAARAQTAFTSAALIYPGGMMIETCPALQDTVGGGGNYSFGLAHYGHGTTIVPSQNMACNVTGILAHGCFLDLDFNADALGQAGSGDTAQDLLFWCGGSDVPGTGTYSNPSDGVFIDILAMATNVGVQGCNWNKSTAAPFYAGSINGGTWLNPGNNATAFGVHLASFNSSPANVAFGTLGGGVGNASVCDAAGSQVNTRGVYFNQTSSPAFSSKFAYAMRNAGCKWVDYGSTDANAWNDSSSADTTFVGTQLSGFGAINDLVLPSGKMSLTSRTTLAGNINLTGGTLFVDTSSTWPPPSGFSPAAPTGVVMLTGTQVGSDFQVSKAAAQTAKTVYTVGGNTESFNVTVTISCDTSSAAATVTPSIIYTDASNTSVTLTGTAAVCTTLGAASNVSFSPPTIRAKNATAIQYSTAIANTPTYDITVGVTPASLF